MDTKQARAVKIGQRVFYQADATVPKSGDFGTVTDKDHARFMVDWDDGVKQSYPLVHCDFVHRVGYMDVKDPAAK